MPELSSAAQAVMDAFLDCSVDAGNYYATRSHQIAAALCAVALYLDNDCQQLIAIAAELEGR